MATGGSGGSTAAADYGDSACGTCVEKTACLSEYQACGSDPGCAAYLKCLNACPLSSIGNADPSCEKACPAVSDSAGQTAQTAFLTCRTSGAGSMCTACGQIPAPTDPDFTQQCATMTDTTPCFVCEDNHCCDTQAACLGDPACKALQACLVGCAKDLSCMDQCYTQASATAFSEWRHRNACALYFCADIDACGTKPLDPCIKCQNLYCADPSAACAHDLQCTLLFDCETPCAPTDMACFSACEAKFPAGMSLLQAEFDCDATYCLNVCSGSG
jgi:hypothetical protein